MKIEEEEEEKKQEKEQWWGSEKSFSGFTWSEGAEGESLRRGD